MKKLIFIGVMGLFVLGSCNSKNTGHEGHDHETVTHNHDEHEGHDLSLIHISEPTRRS